MVVFQADCDGNWDGGLLSGVMSALGEFSRDGPLPILFKALAYGLDYVCKGSKEDT